MPRSGRLRKYPLLSVVAALIVVFTLAACGGSVSAPTAQEPAPTAAVPTAQEPAPTAAAPTAEQEQTAEEEHAEGEEHEHAEGEEHEHGDHDHAEETASIDAFVAMLTPVAEGETLNVVATTSIVGDVVGQVGGDSITLTTLMPIGSDPHTFEPTPQEVGAIAEADVVFVNGFNLEESLIPLIENSGIAPERIIPVSVGVETMEFSGDHDHEHAEGEEHEHADEAAMSEGEHSHSGVDPHTWMSPINVMVWTDNIAAVLAALDPANADTYTANAASYTGELEALHSSIQEQIAQIPAENRKLVTDHTAFGYYAREYGLEQIGAVVPAYSTLAETSAQELAELQEKITTLGVPAIFVGTTVNPDMAEQVAADTGVQLLPVYTGSLSAAGGPADSYIAMMRYNTTQFVTGLSG